MRFNDFFYIISHPKVLLRSKIQKEVERILRELNYQPINEFEEDKDIFIVSFPKSGATWMQCLLTGLLLGMDTRYLSDKLSQEIYPDIHMKSYYKRFYDFNFFKTHNLPNPKYKKVIYLVRDGRDAMISYYHMNKALGLNVTLDEMIINGKGVFPCKWHEHVHAWLENPYSSEILYIKYEDLLLNTKAEIKKIMAFIPLKREEEIIKRVISGCSFQHMKEKEKKWGQENRNWPRNKSFFRKGKIGTFKEEMPKHLIKFFEQEAKTELKKWNYQLLFD